MLVSLTVGKVDAGVAVLLTDDKRLIEFPSILLPPSIQSGSIVDITVSQNSKAEQKAQSQFLSLQEKILNTYGLHAPTPPVLRLRNATQTSIVLEWDPVQLATSTLRSLALYRNGSKAGNIPRPTEMFSTKISGLALNTEYSFYLVLKTSGGTYSSNTVVVKTHEMTNLTGITVTAGVLPPQLRDSLERAVERIGAKLVDAVRIDTTHFVCTEGRGRDWEKAVEMSIPVVRPEWLEGCEREGKIVGVRAYYLDADPRHRVVGSNPAFSQNQSHQSPQSNASMSGAVAASHSQTSLPSKSDPRSPTMQIGGAMEASRHAPPPPPKDGTPSAAGEEDDEDEEDDEGETSSEERPQPPPKKLKQVETDEDDNEEEGDDESDISYTKTKRSSQPAGNHRGGREDMEDVAL